MVNKALSNKTKDAAKKEDITDKLTKRAVPYATGTNMAPHAALKTRIVTISRSSG